MKKWLVMVLMVSVVIMVLACKPATSAKVSYKTVAPTTAEVTPEESVTEDLQEMDELDTQLNDLDQVDLDELEKMELG